MDITKRTITVTEEIVLKNDLLDIQSWVTSAIDSKINNCKQRMLIHWQPILIADPDVETIPANEEDLIAFIAARDDYKSRVERDGERDEEREAKIAKE